MITMKKVERYIEQEKQISDMEYELITEFIKLRKPFLINDFETQKIFWDRRKISKILKENNIPTPNGFILDREEIPNDTFKKSDLDTNNLNDLLQKNSVKILKNKIRPARFLRVDIIPNRRKGKEKRQHHE